MNKTTDMKIEQKLLKCYHCGNQTLMNKAGEHEWGKNDDFCFQYKYTMFFCPVCNKVTLLETYSDETMQSYTYNGKIDWYDDEKILYPISNFDNNAIPKKIKESFEAALKVRNIDNNACFMTLRRTLELILKDKGATKWGLKEKIEEIANKGILPEALKEASKFTKIVGDSAAHGNDSEADSTDVDSLVEFVEYIIEYLYVLPYKIGCYKKKIEEKDRIKTTEDTQHDETTL